IYGWIDVNRNGMIDDGDYYGRTPGRITSNGDTVTGADLTVRINSGSAPSAGLAGSAGSRSVSGSGGTGAAAGPEAPSPVKLVPRSSGVSSARKEG
ncbi:MAG: hypothetical protein ACM3ZO_02295, partial [Clostridia bacterium]